MEVYLLLTFIILILGVVIFKNNKTSKLEKNTLENKNILIGIENNKYQIELSRLNEKINNSTQKEIDLKNTVLSLNEKNETLQHIINDDKIVISQLQTKLIEQNRSIEEKLSFLEQNEEKLKEQFKNLATEIFDNNSKKFSQQNQENIGHLLNPMKVQLTDFKKKVEDVYDKETKDRSALGAELKHLRELNQKMSTEASNLTNALKGNSKKQGVWGEMVLENVLESSGLREGYEYKREVSLKDNDDKSFRPDVIVKLPNNRDIIIDAKTSLTAYNNYMSSDDEIEKQISLKNHIKSIKDHIKGLSNKKYEDLKDINSLDFIFMFIPIEGALLLALQKELALYDDAFKQKIILVSPTTLLVALRAVENTWRYEKQAANITEVYKRAEELYKKFNGFVEDLTKIGNGLKTANDSYDEAFKKLSQGNGNLVRQVTMLKQVSNIKPKKELDDFLVDNAMYEKLD
ncbi:MAG: DNA recombination protein RmuC [Campylobacterota bacterium]|nr:DNA recombination protein RmuC [Campylobacterota bacterium]